MRRSGVDLVCRRLDGFDFIELKIDAYNPLAAAMQILRYGLVYCLSREGREQLGYDEKEVFDATSIRLRVLAPESYYTHPRYGALGLSWLETPLDNALQQFTESKNFDMSFQFWSFSNTFSDSISDRELALEVDALIRSTD